MKKSLPILLIILSACVCGLLCACSLFGALTGTSDTPTYGITVHPNNGQAAFTLTGTMTLADVTYEGHTLSGFYLDSACTRATTADEVASLVRTQNVDVYLAWTKVHVHEVVAIDPVPPTCTEDGSAEGEQCATCGAILTAPVVVPALGHHLVHHEEQAPTCTQTGYDAYDTCSRCDYTTYHAVAATGHTEGAWQTQTAPTCTQEGLEVQHCTVCDEEIAERAIAATGHTEGNWREDLPAGCTTEGARSLLCAVCGAVLRQESTAALTHALVHHDGQAPSCTQDGYADYDTCERCDYTTYAVIAATGHTEGVVVVDVSPTCTEGGKGHTDCSVCGTRMSVVNLSAWGHDEVPHAGLAPTCTEDGYADYVTCRRCDYTSYQALAATGHQAGEWEVSVPPTCTQAGLGQSVCTVCGTVMQDAPIPAKGHTEGAPIVDLSPTCTEGGSSHTQCVDCGLPMQTIPLAALGHAYAPEYHAPTCTEGGYTDYTCTRCGDAYAVLDEPAVTVAHHYEAYLCTACGRCQMEDYDAAFTEAVQNNSRKHFFLIEADDGLDAYALSALFVDWALLHAETIEGELYFKPDVAIEDVDTAHEIWAVINRLHAGSNAYAGSIIGVPYLLCLDVTPQETYASLYPADTEVEGVSYARQTYPTQDSPQAGSRTGQGAARAEDYDAFAYLARANSIAVRTSDQLYLALACGYRPEPVAGSAAERMMESAKAILRVIVTDDMTPYMRLAAIYQWIMDEVSYDYAAYYDVTHEANTLTAYYAEGVFDHRTAVCDGIAKAFCILAGLENIRCVRVAGDGTGEGDAGHAWNAVWVDADGDGTEEWYLVDSTWSLTRSMLGEDVICYGTYRYFLFTTALREADGYATADTCFPTLSATVTVDAFRYFYRDESMDDTVDYRMDSQEELNDFFAYLDADAIWEEYTTASICLDLHLAFAGDDADVQTALSQAFSQLTHDVQCRYSTATRAGQDGVYLTLFLI